MKGHFFTHQANSAQPCVASVVFSFLFFFFNQSGQFKNIHNRQSNTKIMKYLFDINRKLTGQITASKGGQNYNLSFKLKKCTQKLNICEGNDTFVLYLPLNIYTCIKTTSWLITSLPLTLSWKRGTSYCYFYALNLNKEGKFSLKYQMSLCMRKPTFGVPTRSDTNRAVQFQKKIRSLKFLIKEEEGLYSWCSENSDTDQLCSYCVCRLLVL